ncbi:zinc-domain-containing protein [Nitrososphaera sp.]|uniref:zinc-domain-containing protein n=1 Tax=Nitrososphaera sp. TaxID=1971748 RepID=UPI002EDB8B79
MHKTDMLGPRSNPVLEARCARCGKKAQVDDDMENVRCKQCGYSAKYDDYLETMKDKAVMMADDYQMNWDRNPL